MTQSKLSVEYSARHIRSTEEVSMTSTTIDSNTIVQPLFNRHGE